MLNFKINCQLVGISLLLLLTAIPSFAQKKIKDVEQTKVKKAYHNMTHRYNAYFNANLKMKKVITDLETQHQENFNQILPMYQFLAVENAEASGADLDIVIKKSGVAISLHRMSYWSDDSYLLIGRAEFLKKNYQDAENTFKYIISELDPKKLEEEANKKKGKKKKKNATPKSKVKEPKKGELQKVHTPKDKYGNPIVKEEQPKVIAPETPIGEEKEKGYFLKHRPAQKEAILWLAKTQIAMERYDEAFILLNRLRREKEVAQKTKAEIEATEAYSYLKLKEYEKAIKPLSKAIELTKNRKQKIRFTYILGQLHQKAGRGQEAYATYQKVLKLRPLYEMEFNTRLSMAKNAYENEGASIDDAIRDLQKMLKDEKNEEYLDQIYFAMAEIELKRDSRDAAIAYLKKSIYNNVSNQHQKAEAYYLLADLFYKGEIYTSSKYYYDSTLTAMSKKDERYSLVSNRSISLKEIAENIEIIEMQDSLIRIMKMSESKKMALALNIREAERKQKEAAAKGSPAKGKKTMLAAAQPSITDAGRGGVEGTASVGTWWAYDTDIVRKGKKDFEKKWGQRKLTDNWRRSNRKNTEIDGAETVNNDNNSKELTSTEIDAIFNKMGVPKNEKELETVNLKISEAMAALGPLYRDRLKNNRKAIDILEQLMTRYPDNKYKLESAYLLYVMYNEKPDYVNANKYKDLILKGDKENKFAKAITDPKFLEKEKIKQMRIGDYYDNAYAFFESGNAKSALDKIDKVDEVFKPEENTLRSKFALLAAMCEGSLNGKDAYKIGLNEVVKTYVDTEEAKKAAEILKYLGNDGVASAEPSKAAVDGVFSTVDDVHFFIATYDANTITRDQLTANFDDYNKKYNTLQRLRVNSIYLDLETPVLVVKRFKGKDEAMEYYQQVLNGTIKEFLGTDLESKKIVPMVISQENYKVIIRKKNINEYLEFFETEYK